MILAVAACIVLLFLVVSIAGCFVAAVSTVAVRDLLNTVYKLLLDTFMKQTNKQTQK